MKDKEEQKKEIMSYINDIKSFATELDRLISVTDLDKFQLNTIKNFLKEKSENMDDLVEDIRMDIHWGK